MQRVFIAFRCLAFAVLPLSFYVAAVLLRFPPQTAAAASLLAPLVATDGLYGVDYGSYLWNGLGLYPQAVATTFLLLVRQCWPAHCSA